MNRKEFVTKVTANLKGLDARKPVYIKKRQFFIRDSDGHEARFDVSSENKQVAYTKEDVSTILDSCMAVASDALKNGDSVSLTGFGTLGLKKKKATQVRHPTTGEIIDIEETYVPYFKYGNTLAVAAKLYNCSIKELPPPEPEPIYEEDYE